MYRILFLTAITCVLSSAAALSAAQWQKQSIYQIVTDRFMGFSASAACDPYENGGVYCGGTWQGIMNQLDYIQGLGATAIWLSPIVHNVEGNTGDGSAYHGYWADDIYSLNEHFGTSADLSALSDALHNRGMYLMLDVVTNHLAWEGAPDTVDYSSFVPFNSSSYFHPYCSIDYNNATSILDCWEGDTTVGLVDLKTESPAVESIFNTWIKDLVTQYNIDGIRLDSYQQTGIAPAGSFQSAAGVFVMGEVFDGSASKVCSYQQPGGMSVLNYPTYFWITRAFQSSSGSMADLANGLLSMEAACDTTLTGSFMENHDNPRFPSLTNDLSRAMNAITFTMLQDGIPIIYQGQEQHLAGGDTPGQREALWLTGLNTSAPLYQFISKINQFRNTVVSKNSAFVANKIQPVYWDAKTLVTTKGPNSSPVVGVYTNVGMNMAPYTLTLAKSVTGFKKNQQVVDVLSCESFTTDSSGSLALTIKGGMPRVLWSYGSLAGSGICASITPSPTSTGTLPSATCSAASIHFAELVNTTYGENIVVTGSIPALGSWSPAAGVVLNANAYTAASPLWQGDASGIDPGEVFQYKYVVVGTDGSYNFQPGNNLQATAPMGCVPTTTLSDRWPSAT